MQENEGKKGLIKVLKIQYIPKKRKIIVDINFFKYTTFLNRTKKYKKIPRSL